MDKLKEPVGHRSTWQAEVEALRRRVAELEPLRHRVAELEAALIRIADLTQHNMGMTARDETCVYNQARAALQEGEA